MISGTIETSEAKAKAIKGLVDRIINSFKKDLKVSGQPLVQSFLTDKNLKQRVVRDILPKLGTKTSGYTRVVRLGTRLGDQTTMVKISLIGAEELGSVVTPKKSVKIEPAKSKKRSVK